MRGFGHVSIKTKLILLGTLSALMALVLCCAVIFISTARAMRRAKLEKLQTQVAMLGFNSKAVLAFQDASAAAKLLDAFRLEPSIDAAMLYDASGNLLAEYWREAAGSEAPPGSLASGCRPLDDGRLEILLPVSDEREPEGTICLRANMDDYRAQLADSAKVLVLVVIGALLAAAVLSCSLQGSLSAPILKLAQTARQITNGGDYSIRVENRSKDEIGDLYTAFNQMLQTIQTSQAELRQAHDLLEERVKERTAQLHDEIATKEQAQADLVRAKDAAEAANRAKSEFLANMSHEIRTPLNGILGFTKLLVQEADNGNPATRREFLEIIRSSGEHQLALINDILDLSKIESGLMEIECIPCSPHQVIAEVMSLLRVRAQEKGLTLDGSWNGPIPKTIHTDPARLRQLLINLVGNAIKFTERGGVQIIARLIQDEGRPQLAMDVIDTGIGIAEDKLETIFRPFVQADTSVTRKFGGTGLGLAISKRIAAALGGSLTVESRLGDGSTFTAIIDTGPLEGVEFIRSPAEVVTSMPRRSAAGAGGAILPGARILLVEDGDTNRKLIELVLRRAGAEVVSAENGKIGVECTERESFDLILMDMQMPVMDGYTAATVLRQRGLTVPIIALTAHAMRGDEEKCRAAGCSGFLTKPVDPDSLTRTLREVLDSRGCRLTTSDAAWAEGPVLPIASSLPVDDPEFREIVEEFVERLRGKLDEMRQAWQRGDFDALARLAHWLKGSGGTAGFAAFTQPAARLEKVARQQQTEQIETVLDEIAALYHRVGMPVTAA